MIHLANDNRYTRVDKEILHESIREINMKERQVRIEEKAVLCKRTDVERRRIANSEREGI